jgi:hypothetical protein
MSLVSKHHRALELNLKYRRDTTRSYRDNYQEYLSTAYRDISSNKKMIEQLEKIKVGDTDKPEDAMYKTATRLSNAASRSQTWLKTVEKAEHQGSTSVLVAVAPGFKFAALTNLLHPRGDRRFSQIVGSEFGQKQKEKPVYRLTGELPSELIQRVISKRQFELQLCYELALRRNQAANGELEWSWIIDKRGRPQEINLLSSSIQDREMIGCIRNKMSSWTFPRPKNGSIRVRYPFRFQPAKG